MPLFGLVVYSQKSDTSPRRYKSMEARAKTVESGTQFEVEVYPVTKSGHRRDGVSRYSAEAQRQYKKRLAAKKLVRLVNTNFTRGDIIITLTYRAELRPALNYKAVLRDTQNYFLAVKRYRKKNGLPELRYISVIELTGRDNWHVHIIMSAIDRDVAESLWKYSAFVNSKIFQPTDQDGGAAFANYIAGKKSGKESQTVGRNWNCSKNLVQPTVTTKPCKQTRAQIARLARQRIDDSAYWERRYKGYRFVSARAVFNEYNGWWYLYVQMYRLAPLAPVRSCPYPKPNKAATRARC